MAQTALLERSADRPSSEGGPSPLLLRLFDGFEFVRDGQPKTLSENVQRLLACLALAERPQRRSTVAARLWMDTTDERASASLRTALWKLKQLEPRLVVVTAGLLALSSTVRTDVSSMVAQARRLVGGGGDLLEEDIDAAALSADLLPMWDDDWIVFERERLRQLRIHGLEALARRLTSRRRHAEAVDAGLSAVAADPLRESGQRVLIEAHLAEGNLSEARHQYERYRVVLRDALSLSPSSSLQQLLFRVADR